jgi:hypothetical protein
MRLNTCIQRISMCSLVFALPRGINTGQCSSCPSVSLMIENWEKKNKSNAHLDSGDLDPSRQFHRLRVHPLTHTIPRLTRLTVLSPSPNLTPVRILRYDVSSVYSASIQLLRRSSVLNGIRATHMPLAGSTHSGSALATLSAISLYSLPCVYQ